MTTYGNDANIVYQYDIGDRLTRITNNTNSGPIDIQYSQYDNVDNSLNMIVNGQESQYSYDKLYQLTDVDYAAGFGTDANYYYDAVGNWNRVTAGSTTNYSHNSLNQYTAVGVTSYSYDSKGNLINDGTYKYYYDCENRLTDVNTIANGRIAHYTYDFAGRRTEKTTYSGTTVIIKYAYDGDDLIAEYSETGTLIKKYIYGPGIDEPVCMIDVAGGGAKYYYHFDGLGSVVALSNDAKNIVEQYHYNVFGTPSNTSTIGNRFLFTGREYDSEIGNYCYRTRYYKPSIGRFLQTDPIGYGDSMNLYQYCLNNPVNWTDPYGEDIWIGTRDGFHMNINVGDPKGNYDSYSYRVKSEGLLGMILNSFNPFRGGMVYRDLKGAKVDKKRYLETTPQQDREAKESLEQQVGENEGYDFLWGNNCRGFSKDTFEGFEKAYGPQDSENMSNSEGSEKIK